ncbi:Lipid phosphate phosphatase-related protein type 5 [Tupaia chinensis]|uniref:Lipid phosphate phosphatase-related protein type 5 n=1 Tax=Tupaia chinensis TaxID=246437 RepID=L8Y2A7_TUPCH|nr:Lipid phosphate phosphatase-related protein type 5 [Tupaia chinensis]
MLAYYFEYTDTFTVNVQGFFCHDSAYRKPYPGPEDSSAVPPVLLYSLAAGVPVLVRRQEMSSSQAGERGEPGVGVWKGLPLPESGRTFLCAFPLTEVPGLS